MERLRMRIYARAWRRLPARPSSSWAYSSTGRSHANDPPAWLMRWREGRGTVIGGHR
jgi:hypothetical protein